MEEQETISGRPYHHYHAFIYALIADEIGRLAENQPLAVMDLYSEQKEMGYLLMPARNDPAGNIKHGMHTTWSSEKGTLRPNINMGLQSKNNCSLPG